MRVTLLLWLNASLLNFDFQYQRCRKVIKSGGGATFFYSDLGGSGGMPPRNFLGVFVL